MRYDKAMVIQEKNIKTLEDLRQHILGKVPSLYTSSKTSTVIPYDRIKEFIKSDNFFLVNLSGMPSQIQLKPNGNLVLSGAVSWLEAKNFLKNQGRDLKASPTEELALVLAGVATSCTGERSFGFGPFRDHILSLEYMDYQGEVKELKSSQKFTLSSLEKISQYQKSYTPYLPFKNAPFPRLEKETDLLIGTEGQLGVVTKVEMSTCLWERQRYFFIKLPSWKKNDEAHLEIHQKVQKYREAISAVEFTDEKSLNLLDPQDQITKEGDLLFLEVKSSYVEKIYDELFSKLTYIHEDQIFEIEKEKYHKVRSQIPRQVAEFISHHKLLKLGTDTQFPVDKLHELFAIYRKASEVCLHHNLFGHFGDTHLHFNFLPQEKEVSKCQNWLENFYPQVLQAGGSPFAEHGIGILKQKYIKHFYTSIQKDVFRELKQKYDPYQQFFPQGYMHL
ncbi:MAG: FAD-binding oxidoreductase [Bacteriovoracaceae bacterium]|nr:FAD-binding oxidoreductase [Bacteriovoracaceae bacterium]